MDKYNYRESIREDIQQYIYDNGITTSDFENKSDMFERLYDDMWVCDEITGNASGSYTFNAWAAEENLCHNLDLLEDAFLEFGLTEHDLTRGAEFLDVTIRCYLLSEILSEEINTFIDDRENWED